MDLLHLALYAVLGGAAGLLGWLLTRRIVRFKPQVANITTAALVAGIVAGGTPLLSPMLEEWSANRELHTVGLQIYGNERAAGVFAQEMKAFVRDRALLERLEKERAATLKQAASDGGLANNQQALFAELSAGGIGRLPGEALDDFFATKRAVAEASPELCAGFWTGRMRPEAMIAALRRLPENRQLGWIRSSALAAQLELHASSPAARIPGALVDQASTHMIAALDPEPRAGYLKVTSAGATTDGEACAAFKAVGQGLDRLSADERRLIILAIQTPQLIDR